MVHGHRCNGLAITRFLRGRVLRAENISFQIDFLLDSTPLLSPDVSSSIIRNPATGMKYDFGYI